MFFNLRTNHVRHTATIYIVRLSGILLFFSILFYVIWSRSDRVTVFSFRIANMTCCDDISDDVRRSSSEPQLGSLVPICYRVCGPTDRRSVKTHDRQHSITSGAFGRQNQSRIGTVTGDPRINFETGISQQVDLQST